jgi:aminoglycoside 6'-N-acetyltransferase
MSALYVAVCGSGAPDEAAERDAEQVGRLLGAAGAIVVCGGLGGVMEAACRGARDREATTVGILPGVDRSAANPHVAVAIPTGMGEMRNALIVRSARVVVAVDGEYGTLSEIALALKMEIPVVGLRTWDLPGIRRAETPEEAAAAALEVGGFDDHGTALDLRGERVRLRSGRVEDVARLAEIRREPEVFRWWGGFEVPDVWEDFVGSGTGFVVEVDGEVIGGIEYHEESDPMYRHAGIDLFLSSSRHNQGLGTESLRLLARYLFDDRRHHRLTIDPAEENQAAIRAYERVGFRAVGTMRRYELAPDGSWRNALLMDMLRDDFRDRAGARTG